MKILWFSNTCANAAEHLGDDFVRGGWIQSLDKTLQDHIDLHVAFYYHKLDSPFKYKNTTYHPISPKNWKLQTIKNHIFKQVVDQEDLSSYLAIIDEVKPDLIHIHGTENSFRCILNKVNIPVVVSIQGILTPYVHKYTSGIEIRYLSVRKYNIKDGYKNILFSSSFNSDRKLSLKRTVFELRDLRYCQHIIGRTAWDRRISSIMAPGSSYYHNDEILRDIFYSEKWTYISGKERFIIQSTSGNSPYKGFETICETIYLLNLFGFPNLEWRVAGISESDLIVKVVKKKLKRKYPSSGLVFLGTIKEKELVEKMKEAHLFVMASHIENSPNSLCEAMILGMPCIATYAGGTASLLKDGEDGILIQDGDPWSMAGAILEIKNDPEKALEYGKNARKKALIRHDRNKIASELLSIYSKIITNK